MHRATRKGNEVSNLEETVLTLGVELSIVLGKRGYVSRFRLCPDQSWEVASGPNWGMEREWTDYNAARNGALRAATREMIGAWGNGHPSGIRERRTVGTDLATPQRCSQCGEADVSKGEHGMGRCVAL